MAANSQITQLNLIIEKQDALIEALNLRIENLESDKDALCEAIELIALNKLVGVFQPHDYAQRILYNTGYWTTNKEAE